MLRAFVAAVLLVASAAADARTFRSAACGCTFDVPSSWEVVSNPRAKLHSLRRRSLGRPLERCAFGLRPKRWTTLRRGNDDRDFGEYAITVYVTAQPFREAARDAFFERIDRLRRQWDAPELEPNKKSSNWILFGRQSARHDAAWIRSANWFGLRGTAAIGYYGRGGTGYRGMDDAYRAVLSTGRWRTALILADNPFTEAEFNRVVESFRFE